MQLSEKLLWLGLFLIVAVGGVFPAATLGMLIAGGLLMLIGLIMSFTKEG